jgi:hypothetical protein
VGGERVVTGNSPSITRPSVTVTEVVANVVTAHRVTSKSMSVVGVRRAMRAQGMATPPMTNVRPATMGSKSMKAAPAVATTSAVPTTTSAMPTTSAVPTASTAFCDCRSVRDDAKRANRNARCQNTYCFLFHGGFAQSTSKASGSQRSRADLPILTIVDAASFEIGKSKFH